MIFIVFFIFDNVNFFFILFPLFFESKLKFMILFFQNQFNIKLKIIRKLLFLLYLQFRIFVSQNFVLVLKIAELLSLQKIFSLDFSIFFFQLQNSHFQLIYSFKILLLLLLYFFFFIQIFILINKLIIISLLIFVLNRI